MIVLHSHAVFTICSILLKIAIKFFFLFCLLLCQEMFSQKLSSFQQTSSFVWFILCHVNIVTAQPFPRRWTVMFHAILHFSPYFWCCIKAEWSQKQNFSFTRDTLQAPLINYHSVAVVGFDSVCCSCPLLQSLSICYVKPVSKFSTNSNSCATDCHEIPGAL